MQSSVADDEAVLKGQLRRLGIPEDIDEGILQLSKMIKDHTHFGQLMKGMSGQERANFYNTVRPNLRFKAHPLHWYITQAQQKAERERLPTTTDGGKTLKPFSPASDAASIKYDILDSINKNTLTLKCAKCPRQQSWSRQEGETPTAVVRRARLAGWVYDFKLKQPRELCPECAVA